MVLPFGNRPTLSVNQGAASHRLWPDGRGACRIQPVLTFTIAGIRGRAARLPAAVVRRLRAFESGGNPDVTFETTPLAPRPSRRPDIRMRGNRIAGPHVRVEWRGDRIAGRVSPTVAAWDALLKAVWSRRLAGRGGMLLHAAAVLVDGGAVLLPGPSGAGKSTLARKAPRRLADDSVAVLEGRAYGTPMGRRPSPPGSWPIRAVWFCEKNSTDAAPLSRAAASARLLRNVIWFSDESDPCAAVFALTAPAAVVGSLRREPFDAVLERARAAV